MQKTAHCSYGTQSPDECVISWCQFLMESANAFKMTAMHSSTMIISCRRDSEEVINLLLHVPFYNSESTTLKCLQWTQGEAERRWVRKSARERQIKCTRRVRVSRPLDIFNIRWMKALSAGSPNAFSSVWWTAFRSRCNEVRVGGQEGQFKWQDWLVGILISFPHSHP